MLEHKYTQWFSKNTIENLEKYGKFNIVKLSLGKYDVCQKFLRYSFMNILSDGIWSKELIKRNINKLKHTYIICTIKDETDTELNIVLSKEFVFTCDIYEDWIKPFTINDIVELAQFNPDINITIDFLIEQTIKNIGDAFFFIWSPISTCQDFTKNILLTIDALNYKYVLLHKYANIRLYDETANHFIIQHIDNMFSIMPNRVNVFFDMYTLTMKKFYGIDIEY